MIHYSTQGALSPLHTPPHHASDERGVMQMSEALALIQVLVGVATFIVAVLTLQKENPPNNGGNSNKEGED